MRGPLFRLDQQGSPAGRLAGQQLEQPVVKTTNFHDRHVTPVAGRLRSQLGEKLSRLPPIGADLSTQHDIPRFVPQIYCQLLAMLIDSQVKHG
jgi:hypothetical protein